jgi:hypothetical protein
MTFKFEILVLGQQMKMDKNNFEFIYFPIMDEFHPMICLFNSNHKWNSSMKKMAFIHVKSFMMHPPAP